MKVLGLYRKWSGEMRFGYGVMLSAGPFSIQRLEVSRSGSLPLWVLNRFVGGCKREIVRDASASAGEPDVLRK